MLIFIVVISVIICTIYYFNEKAKYWQRRGVNGPKALLFFGNLLEQLWKPYNEVENERMQKYGRVYGTMQGWIPVITIGEPKLLKKMLTSDFRIFMNHRVTFPGDPVMKRMLIEVNGDEWRRMRAIMSPTFTTGKLKAMNPLIENCVDNTLKYFDIVAKSEVEFDVKLVSLSFTLDTIAKTVFGVDTNWYENPKHEFILRADDMVDFNPLRVISKMICPSIIQKMLDIQVLPKKHTNYFIEHLKNILDERRKKKSNVTDFITLLLNAELKHDENGEINVDAIQDGKKRLTDDEITANLFLFFTAGYETTSTFLCFALYAMAIHPEIQEKLYEEIHEYFDQHKTIDYNSLKSLPYFDAFVNETLRLYTPVVIFEHVCGEDYKLGDTGIMIEKGTVVNLPFYAMHHDPELFPNPNEFVPQRFLSENQHEIEPYSFMPFGAGPRICIGNRLSAIQSKIFLAKLVHSFKVLKCENTPLNPEYNGHFIFLKCKPIMVKVERR